MRTIGAIKNCSPNTVRYWLDKYGINRRSIGDALYEWHHPKGDPFVYRQPETEAEHRLFGIGIGLYWGEGTKASPFSVRLGNTDPALLHIFLEFLQTFFGIQRKECKFGLQLFSDIEEEEALDFWTKKLKIHRLQFYKTTFSPSVSSGTYRRKSRYGVLTIYYNNRKVRDLLLELLIMHGFESPNPASKPS